MELLKQRIQREGVNMGHGILKVDSFINHQVDPALMLAVGGALAARFAHLGANKIVTAEISGIAPALTTGLALGIPVVYARKTKPVTMHPNTMMASRALPHQRRHDRADGLARIPRAARPRPGDRRFPGARRDDPRPGGPGEEIRRHADRHRRGDRKTLRGRPRGPWPTWACPSRRWPSSRAWTTARSRWNDGDGRWTWTLDDRSSTLALPMQMVDGQ